MKKNVSVMCFHDELCQVFNALMTALSLLREGSKVTLFFGSRGINAVHKERVKELRCLPDQPKEEGEAVMKMSMRRPGAFLRSRSSSNMRLPMASTACCSARKWGFGKTRLHLPIRSRFPSP